MKYILYFFIFSVVIVPIWLIPSNNVRIITLDVGQGDSILIRLPRNIDILVDTGPDDRLLAQLGQHMAFRDTTIELLVISHFHSDHIGGIPALLSRYTVDEIWYAPSTAQTMIAETVRQLIQNRHIIAKTVAAGDVLQEEQWELLVLHPPNHDPPPTAEVHDTTIALRFRYGRFCILLTGDLHFEHEEILIDIAQKLGQSLHCAALKVTHHGSATGSGTALLQAVQPAVALISVGQKNRYRHPAPATLQRLQEIGASIYRTDVHGTVTIETDSNTFWTKTEK